MASFDSHGGSGMRRQVMVAALAFFQGPAGCVRGSWFFLGE